MAFPHDVAEGVGTARRMRDEKQRLMDAEARCRCSSGGIRWSIYAGKRYLSFFQRMKAPASIWVPGPERYSDFIFSGGPPVPGRIIPWYRRKKDRPDSWQAAVPGSGRVFIRGVFQWRRRGQYRKPSVWPGAAGCHALPPGREEGRVFMVDLPMFFLDFPAGSEQIDLPWHPECRSREDVLGQRKTCTGIMLSSFVVSAGRISCPDNPGFLKGCGN